MPDDKFGAPPEWDRLLSACQKNNVDLIKSLMEQEGVSPSHANGVGQSALHIASLWGHVECVKVLLDAGANVHAANKITGATPLHCAIQSSKASTPELRKEVVQLLVQKDHNLVSVGDLYGSIPYDYCNDDEELKALVQPTVPAIFAALKERNAEKVSQILSEDASSAISTRHLSLTPLLYVVQQLCDGDEADDKDALLQLLTLLLNNGASPAEVPTTNRDGHLTAAAPTDATPTPLHQVCVALQDAYRAKDDSRHVFMSAARALVASSSSSGAVSTTVSEVLLHDAARRGHLELVQFCLELKNSNDDADADAAVIINARGRQGMTPLHFAARSGQTKMVEYLLSQSDIDVSIADDRGKTALAAAQTNNKQEVVDLLMKHEHDKSTQ